MDANAEGLRYFKQCSEGLEYRTRKYILCFLYFKQCSEGLEHIYGGYQSQRLDVSNNVMEV